LVRAAIALFLIGPLLAGSVLVALNRSAPSMPDTPAAHGVREVRYPAPPKPHNDAAVSVRPGHDLWPAARSGTADVAARRTGSSPTNGRVAVPGTPVWVQPASSASAGPTRVAVRVGGHTLAQQLGITGVVFSVAPRAGSGSLSVGLDYAAFADAYGGNFGERLKLIELPACAMTSPTAPSCREQRAVPTATNWARQQTTSARVALGPAHAPMVLAATSTTYTSTSGDDGDGGGSAGSYTATSLSASGTWSGGGSSGDFTYSYPITVPPAVSSMTPNVSLSYDSGSLDGQTVATQAQSNWLGDGWDTPENYVEQSFVPCSDNPEGSAAPESTNDECYDGQVLTLSLNGSSISIVYDATAKKYVPADDNGDVITHITDSNNGTKTND
jgi:hypothetical protein